MVQGRKSGGRREGGGCVRGWGAAGTVPGYSTALKANLATVSPNVICLACQHTAHSINGRTTCKNLAEQTRLSTDKLLLLDGHKLLL